MKLTKDKAMYVAVPLYVGAFLISILASGAFGRDVARMLKLPLLEEWLVLGAFVLFLVALGRLVGDIVGWRFGKGWDDPPPASPEVEYMFEVSKALEPPWEAGEDGHVRRQPSSESSSSPE